MIFVIDSADRERIGMAKEDLIKEINAMDEMNDNKKTPLLVYANKQDLPGALSAETIAECLGNIKNGRRWHVQPACATRGEGLIEGLEWAASL
jgi:signal recognition particle receptor subunit beta